MPSRTRISLILKQHHFMQNKIMLGLAVQPPAGTRPGTTLYPPLAVKLSSEHSLFDELSDQWAVVTLVRSSGEVLHNKLSGRLTDSAHPLPTYGTDSSVIRRRDRAYFYFPDLKIDEPGRYKIRVSLMKMEYSKSAPPEGQARVCEEVDSRSILVEEMQPSHMSPRKCLGIMGIGISLLTTLGSPERAFLRVLAEDGQHVPAP